MNFRALKHGDVVDIISPATACTQDEINEIKKFVKKIGLIPRIIEEASLTLKKPATHEFPSFSSVDRFTQLKYAIENKESKIIWCARGGYGSTELLPFLQKMDKPKNQKIFIGFSDLVSITTFLQQKWHWRIICGPMLAQIALSKVSKKSEKAIVDLIFGKVKKLEYEVVELTSPNPSLLRRGEKKISSLKKGVSAEIVGGCVSVLAGHFGTKNQIDWENKILFLEDEGEDGERLDRYFNQILTIILEKNKYPAAILLGNFLEANPHGTPKAKNIKISLHKLVAEIDNACLGIPVFLEKSKSLGHSKSMNPLFLGLKTKIIGSTILQTICN